jgi:hypothetical protein
LTRPAGCRWLPASLAVALLIHGDHATGQDRTGFAVDQRHIVYHDVKTDATGGIVPWYSEKPSVAYDHDIRVLWDFWKNMRKTPGGVPYYLLHQVWREHEDDPRGMDGDEINMALDSWNLLYGYLGDPAIHQDMTTMADYWLDHGTSKPDILWANLVYPYNTNTYLGEYDGDMQAGKDYLQPDKAGSFGSGLIVLYKITGNKRYLAAAVKIADTLANRVVRGDGMNSPWPFRVNAVSGVVSRQRAKDPHDGTIYIASYTTSWTPTLNLFSEFEALHQGRTSQYREAAEIATAWMKKYPLQTYEWGSDFDDIPTYSNTEINADTIAAYLLDHPEWDPDWKVQSRSILDWVERRLGNHNFEQLQVIPIDEQTVYSVPGNSHTSRHASVQLLYCEKTGECADKQQAIRRLNWATYSVNDDGKNRYPYDDIWLTDGYGDYVRHYLRSMASAPELAPDDQNHLLRSSSIIQNIAYSPHRITYQKFDAQSEERLKLGGGIPRSVTGGSMNWDTTQKLLTVHATANQVTILLDASAH